MRVLGVDTATSLCSVGIAGDSGFEADYRIHRGYIHGEYLSLALKEVIKACGITLEDIDGFAVSIGPGSFTGLRIGLGLIKGIVFGKQRPVAAIPTMDGLMDRVPPIIKHGCVLLTARKGEVYQGKYRYLNGKWERDGDFQVVREEDIGKGFSEKEIIFIGNGVKSFSPRIIDRVKRPRFIQEDFSLPSGFSIAKIGREMIEQGEVVDIDKIVPLYLKRFKGVM